MTCSIEGLADNLPKPRRGLTEPHIDFLNRVVDDDGEEVVFWPDETILLRVIVPMLPSPLLDMAAAVDLLAWWPDLPERIAAALASYDPVAVVDQLSAPTETDDGEKRIWLSVIMPTPRSLLKTIPLSEMVAEMVMPSLQEGAAHQIRQYQVARRLAV